MEMVLLILFVVIVIWYVSHRVGNPKFWKIASKYPDDAYDWFMAEECWVVLDPRSELRRTATSRSDYSGPFYLWIPKLGNQKVKLYCRRDCIEESQRKFMERCGGQ